MKNTLKKLLIAFIAVLGVASLTSCNHANTYNKFHNNSSNLAKSHVLKEISISDLKGIKNKLDKDKDVKGSKSVVVGEGDSAKTYTYVYIFLGTPTNSTASTNAQIFDEQAKQNEISCLYWIDTDLSDSKIKKLTDDLPGITEIKAQTTALVSIRKEVGTSINPVISFDSTSVKCNRKDGIASGTELTAYQIAQNCFKNSTSIN